MKKKVFLLFLVMIFTIVIPVQAAEDVSIVENHVKENLNGSFVISIKVDNEWKQLSSLSYGRYQEEQSIDIGDYLNSKNINLKLTKNGGGAAYLDSVLLDGNPAINAIGKPVKVLSKLSKNDFDVIQVDEDGFELVFQDSKIGKLNIIGRIESEVISKEPLQFPINNNYKSRDEISGFYNYKLNNCLGTVIADGVLDEVEKKDPFVKDYRVPGSGHPAGYSYFWVTNDNQNLYVTMDVTPDNTFDGDKDYAKVYIKTVEGVKEYKISVLETTWGNTSFTYTDKVGYEHKVYEFIIPLEELMINNMDAQEIKIAFAIYGTVSLIEGYYNLDVAYDSVSDLYLSVFEYLYEVGEYNWDRHIYGQIVGSNGVPIGDKFLINNDSEYQSSPAVAYDVANETFLVVWSQSTSYSKIYAQTVSIVESDNSYVPVMGDMFRISGNIDFRDEETTYYEYYDEFEPDLSYDRINERFLVVWQQHCNDNPAVKSTSEYDIYGRIVYSDGSFIDEALPICTDDEYQVKPSVSYSFSNERFLVAWAGDYSESYNLKVRVVEDSGELLSEGLIIPVSRAYNPNVSANERNGCFLLTWEDGDIYGTYVIIQLQSGVAVPKIADDDPYQISPDDYFSNCYPSAYNDGGGRLLCVWNAVINDVHFGYARMRYIDEDGILDDEAPFTDIDEVNRDELEDDDYITSISMTGNGDGNFLIAYILHGYNDIGYRFIGEDEPIVEEPEIAFENDPYTVYVGKTKQVKVVGYNLNQNSYALLGEDNDYTDITFDGNTLYFVGDPYLEQNENEYIKIDENGLITGKRPGITTISAIHLLYQPNIPTAFEVDNESLLDTESDSEYGDYILHDVAQVTVKQVPVNDGPSKTLIGQIIVDGKVVKNIYKEDVRSKDEIYSFTASKSGDYAKLWLNGGYYEDIAEKYPERILQFNWDYGTYSLPLNIEGILTEIDDISNSKLNIIIENLSDEDTIDMCKEASEKMGGQLVSNLIDFSVTVEGKEEKAEIDSFDFYVIRTINSLDEIDGNDITAMKYLEDKELLTFAPSVFNNSDDDFYTTVKYRGNGTFTVIYNPHTFDDIKDHWAKLNIEKLAARNIAFGRDENNFKPNDSVTRAEFAVMITRALGITEEEGTKTFSDVSNEWFAEDIKTAYDAGLINGKSDGRFYPNDKIMRKDMAVMIYNAIEFVNGDLEISNTDKLLSAFTDSFNIDEYAKKGVALCSSNNIILGRDTGEFDPDANATRAEASAIIERMLRYLDFIN